MPTEWWPVGNHADFIVPQVLDGVFDHLSGGHNVGLFMGLLAELGVVHSR